MRTRKTIGLILFFIAVGMLLMIFLDNTFVGILIVTLLLLLGYNMYCN